MVRKYSLKQDGEKKLSEHFKVKEFACKNGNDYILIDDDLIEVLESLRLKLCKPIHITSGYRDNEYNIKVGGASNSNHVKGKAADIIIQDVSPAIVGLYAASVGARGVGIYKNFTHVDTRDVSYMWLDKGVL